MRLLASRDESKWHGQSIHATLSGDDLTRIKRRACLWSCRRVALGRNVSSERAMYCFSRLPAVSALRGPSCGSRFPGHTPAVRWKLARIRWRNAGCDGEMRDFDKDATDPVTGEAVSRSSDRFQEAVPNRITRRSVQFAVISTSTVERQPAIRRRAAMCGDRFHTRVVRRSLSCSSERAVGDGRIVGNVRSFAAAISFSPKRTPATAVIRRHRDVRCAIGPGNDRRALTTKALSWIARDGQKRKAVFLRDKVFPEKNRHHLFYCRYARAGSNFADAQLIHHQAAGDSVPGKNRMPNSLLTAISTGPWQVVKKETGISVPGLTIPDIRRQLARHAGYRRSRVEEGTLNFRRGWERNGTFRTNRKLWSFRNRCMGQYDGRASSAEISCAGFFGLVEAKQRSAKRPQRQCLGPRIFRSAERGRAVHWKATWTHRSHRGEADRLQAAVNAYPEVGPISIPPGDRPRRLKANETDAAWIRKTGVRVAIQRQFGIGAPMFRGASRSHPLMANDRCGEILPFFRIRRA